MKSRVVPTFWYKDKDSEVGGKIKEILLKCYLILPKFYIIKPAVNSYKTGVLCGIFWLIMLDSSNLFALYVIYISAIALHFKFLLSYVLVLIKQMICRELYIHLSPVYIQISPCLTMIKNE